MTPCFFLQCYESPQIDQCLAAFKTIGLSVQTYSFSANETWGSRGSPRAGKLWAADCRLRCWLVTKLSGFWTAVCSWYLEQFFAALVSRKPFRHGIFFFCNLLVTIQIVNSDSENSLLSHSLTLAPRCPVRRFRISARVVCPTGERVGKNRLTACDIFKVTVTLPSPIRAVTVTR